MQFRLCLPRLRAALRIVVTGFHFGTSLGVAPMGCPPIQQSYETIWLISPCSLLLTLAGGLPHFWEALYISVQFGLDHHPSGMLSVQSLRGPYGLPSVLSSALPGTVSTDIAKLRDHLVNLYALALRQATQLVRGRHCVEAPRVNAVGKHNAVTEQTTELPGFAILLRLAAAG